MEHLTIEHLTLEIYDKNNKALKNERNIGNMLRLIMNEINKQLDERLLPLGLTSAQWRPIVLLDSGTVNTAAQLAEAIGVDTGAMTRTISRLEAKGLVVRERSLSDRRVVELTLTEKSRDLSIKILKTIEEVLFEFFSCLSGEEFRTYVELNKKLIRHNMPEFFLQLFPEEPLVQNNTPSS